MIYRNFFVYAIFTVLGFCCHDAYSQSHKLGTSRVLSIGTAGGLQIGFKSYPQSLRLADKELILTFDDGPMTGSTGKVLDALAEQDVKATFFLIGRNAKAHAELVQRMAAEGHTIATHSQSHPMTLRDMNEGAARTNIESGIESVTQALGYAPAPFFRYPGFGDSPQLNSWLAAQNIGIFGTDIWASDWITMTPEVQLNLLMRRIRASGHGIVLLHDIRLQTTQMMPDFLMALKREGYKIVHMVPGNSFSQTDKASVGWSSETEHFLTRRKSKSVWPPQMQ